MTGNVVAESGKGTLQATDLAIQWINATGTNLGEGKTGVSAGASALLSDPK